MVVEVVEFNTVHKFLLKWNVSGTFPSSAVQQGAPEAVMKPVDIYNVIHAMLHTVYNRNNWFTLLPFF